MTRTTMAVIGAGQIGSRHLQSLARYDDVATVFVVDPSSESLRFAEGRLAEVIDPASGVEVIFTTELEPVNSTLDLAIVATAADVRREVIENLLARVDVPYLILEKVAFQSDLDFEHISTLLKQRAVRAWVNCPRRMWPLYQDLKDKLRACARLECHVSGSNWGLGCNAIHFIDLLAYIIDDTRLTLSPVGLDSKPIPSKRAGFLEFTGTLSGRFPNGAAFTLTSYPSGDAPLLVQLLGDNFRCVISESDGHMWTAESTDEWQWRKSKVSIPYQSELTLPVVKSILSNGECDLTDFEESQELHRPLLNTLIDHLQHENGREITKCPIT